MSDEYAAPPPPGAPPAAPPQPRVSYRPAPPSRPRGRVPRWLWWVLAAGVLVIIAGSVWAFMLDQRANNLTPASVGTTGRLHSAQVVSGMCLEGLRAGVNTDSAASDSAGSVTAVECSQPHRAEAVSSYRFREAAWPGDAEVARRALEYCAGQLAPGGPLEVAAEGREWVAWVPSEGTWNGGDRAALCIVTADDPWTGRATASEVHAEA